MAIFQNYFIACQPGHIGGRQEGMECSSPNQIWMMKKIMLIPSGVARILLRGGHFMGQPRGLENSRKFSKKFLWKFLKFIILACFNKLTKHVLIWSGPMWAIVASLEANLLSHSTPMQNPWEINYPDARQMAVLLYICKVREVEILQPVNPWGPGSILGI